MRHGPGDGRQRDPRAGGQPPERPAPPGRGGPRPGISPEAVRRRGLLQAGLALSALVTAGGVTAWALPGEPGRPGRSPAAASARVPQAPEGTPGSTVPGSTAASAAPPGPRGSGHGDGRGSGHGDAGRPLPLRYFGPSGQRNVYFTIDDGWFPSSRVLEIMRSEAVPVTTFLIVDAAREHLGFWRDFADAGGRIENHTVSHPYLTSLPPGEAERQWAQPQQAFRRWFGRTPVLGRPPYGAINDAVSAAARNAGLTTMVAWSAVDNSGTVQTWNRQRLSDGEIALSHWDPGAGADLAQLVAAARENGLTPAYLPGAW
jgi:peptidoglycan/xylan/chitin deacetylase (PgdA/CDA1 family)